MTLTPFKRHAEFLLAGVAFFVSSATLVVYLYQARMMRQQQHASVWPYLESYYSNVADYRLAVKNKGVGPAIIQRVEMSYDGHPLADDHALVDAVMGPGAACDFEMSTLDHRVLAPGEEVVYFRIPDPAQAKAFQVKKQGHTFGFKITYASVYGDRWESQGLDVKALPPQDLHLF